MPSEWRAARKQKAVYWAASNTDDYSAPLLAAPIELLVRWVESQQEGMDPQGNPVGNTITVVVDREIAIGSIMWLGAEADLPGSPTNLKQVIGRSRTPDVKGRSIYWDLALAKYSNSLPTLV